MEEEGETHMLRGGGEEGEGERWLLVINCCPTSRKVQRDKAEKFIEIKEKKEKNNKCVFLVQKKGSKTKEGNAWELPNTYGRCQA